MTRTLIVVDVQNDFCEGGSLAVDGGAAVAQRISDFIAGHRDYYDQLVATADWHSDPGTHWSDHPDFVESWPVHCRAGSPGAAFHPAIAAALANATVFHKGEYQAAYSGFEGHLPDETTLLDDWLHQRGATEVDVCGIATDYCVRATALDAVHNGYQVRLLTQLVAGVARESSERALTELAAAGVRML